MHLSGYGMSAAKEPVLTAFLVHAYFFLVLKSIQLTCPTQADKTTAHKVQLSQKLCLHWSVPHQHTASSQCHC